MVLADTYERLFTILEMNPARDHLCYLLMFWHGTPGWHFKLMLRGCNDAGPGGGTPAPAAGGDGGAADNDGPGGCHLRRQRCGKNNEHCVDRGTASST